MESFFKNEFYTSNIDCREMFNMDDFKIKDQRFIRYAYNSIKHSIEWDISSEPN